MEASSPSRTAEYMAFFRALESARPAKERLFSDSFAVHSFARLCEGPRGYRECARAPTLSTGVRTGACREHVPRRLRAPDSLTIFCAMNSTKTLHKS
jgi:O-methyltransferase involved in polyketide biosynthesis